MRQRLTSIMSWAVIASEFSHVFCCILPTLFSVLTVLAGLGLITIVPHFIMDWHDAIHAYEIPIILTSGVITVLAWLVYFSARKVDCHDTGCGHPPCAPRKSRAYKVLMIGTVLFAVNVSIFLFLHYLPEKGAYTLGAPAAESHLDHNHEDHDHGHAAH